MLARQPQAISREVTVPFRFLIQTFGCQMNAHDSDRMAGVLRAAGGVAVDRPDDADLVVFNTCSVREKAEQKLRSEVGRLAPLKRERPDIYDRSLAHLGDKPAFTVS